MAKQRQHGGFITKVLLVGCSFFCLFSIAFPVQSPAAFHPAEIIEKTESPFRLYRVDSSPIFADRSYQAYSYVARRPGGNAEVILFEVEFRPLDRAQFEYLRATYGNGQSLVAYQPGREYRLSDFFPPILQGVMNYFYVPEAKSYDSDGALLAVNCWGLALPFVRRSATALPGMTLFYSPEEEFRAFIDTSKAFELIPPTGRADQISNSSAMFGDLVLHRWQSVIKGYVDHVSIFIDKDLYFEKAGPQPDKPFRLVSFPAYSVTGRANYEYRRPRPEALLPHPERIFRSRAIFNPAAGITVVPGQLASAEMLFEFDSGGRAVIPSRYLIPHWGAEIGPEMLGGMK